MPSLKKLTKELRQEIVSYLFSFPPITNNLAFRLAILIFAKTRFCSHINFIGRCLHSQVIRRVFALIFMHLFLILINIVAKFSVLKILFSRNITRITIRAMCQKRDDLDKQILHYRSELCKDCPAILVQSIRAKIQEVNSKLFTIYSKLRTKNYNN